jgi:ABC-type glutathione transport system ATPase component
MAIFCLGIFVEAIIGTERSEGTFLLLNAGSFVIVACYRTPKTVNTDIHVRKYFRTRINEPLRHQPEDRPGLSFGAEPDGHSRDSFKESLHGARNGYLQLNQHVARREEHLLTENRSLRAEVSAKYNHFFAVGVSQAMQTLNKLIQKVLLSRASVLLLGESGTGKTLTARIIHELGERRRNPFAKVNCAALPGT